MSYRFVFLVGSMAVLLRHDFVEKSAFNQCLFTFGLEFSVLALLQESRGFSHHRRITIDNTREIGHTVRKMQDGCMTDLAEEHLLRLP